LKIAVNTRFLLKNKLEGFGHFTNETLKRIVLNNPTVHSCSRRGLISLNWRLIQTPDFVRDYVILHELAHLKHMNHSPRFWAEVARICPAYETAEEWLKRSGKLVL
jgi:predicted metal-dependent hydrolase